jgi:two-component system, OmpR family, KDP operon response regulator KdpE
MKVLQYCDILKLCNRSDLYLDFDVAQSNTCKAPRSGSAGKVSAIHITKPCRWAMSKLANTILVIDDEPQIRRFIRAGLELHGYSVRLAVNASTGLEAAQSPPDLIILDLGLPDMSGVEVLNTIRSRSNVPIIVLSVQVEEEQKVHLLRSGADDYVVKPFGIAELAARCEAALRRCHKAGGKDPVVQTGPLKVDLVSRAVTLDGRDIALMPQEYRVLHLLASRLGLVISHEQLMNDVWGQLSPNKLQYLRMLVRQLRQKLEVDPGQPKLLISESGVGYRLERCRPVDR